MVGEEGEAGFVLLIPAPWLESSATSTRHLTSEWARYTDCSAVVVLSSLQRLLVYCWPTRARAKKLPPVDEIVLAFIQPFEVVVIDLEEGINWHQEGLDGGDVYAGNCSVEVSFGDFNHPYACRCSRSSVSVARSAT